MKEVSDTGLMFREARSSLGWTQAQVARRAKVSVGLVNKLEQGGSGRLGNMKRVARALGLHLALACAPVEPIDTDAAGEQEPALKKAA